jgi:primosomal protein N''
MNHDNAREIIDDIIDTNLYDAKDKLVSTLYAKAGEQLEAYREDKSSDIIDNVSEIAEELSKEQKAYKSFFTKMLKKWDVESPDDIPDDKKDEFFDAVKKGWKNHKDNDSEGEGE